MRHKIIIIFAYVWCSMMEQHNIKWKLICGCSEVLITNAPSHLFIIIMITLQTINWALFLHTLCCVLKAISSKKSQSTFCSLLNGPTRPIIIFMIMHYIILCIILFFFLPSIHSYPIYSNFYTYLHLVSSTLNGMKKQLMNVYNAN